MVKKIVFFLFYFCNCSLVAFEELLVKSNWKFSVRVCLDLESLGLFF